jgi:hypothetical protein
VTAALPHLNQLRVAIIALCPHLSTCRAQSQSREHLIYSLPLISGSHLKFTPRSLDSRRIRPHITLFLSANRQCGEARTGNSAAMLVLRTARLDCNFLS